MEANYTDFRTPLRRGAERVRGSTSIGRRRVQAGSKGVRYSADRFGVSTKKLAHMH